MTPETVRKAVAEAKEFQRRAQEWLKVESGGRYSFPREGGSLRRQSMELTRALAEMQKP